MSSTKTCPISRVRLVSVNVRDPDAAITFWRDTVGFALGIDQPHAEGDRWIEVFAPGAQTGLTLVGPANPSWREPEDWSSALFACEDIDRAVALLRPRRRVHRAGDAPRGRPAADGLLPRPRRPPVPARRARRLTPSIAWCRRPRRGVGLVHRRARPRHSLRRNSPALLNRHAALRTRHESSLAPRPGRDDASRESLAADARAVAFGGRVRIKGCACFGRSSLAPPDGGPSGAHGRGPCRALSGELRDRLAPLPAAIDRGRRRAGARQLAPASAARLRRGRWDRLQRLPA